MEPFGALSSHFKPFRAICRHSDKTGMTLVTVVRVVKRKSINQKKKKSCIRETPNLSTDIFVSAGVEKGADSIIFQGWAG